MIDTTQQAQLISAFRVETEKEAISVGALLQNITDLLATATNTNGFGHVALYNGTSGACPDATAGDYTGECGSA